MTSCPCCSGVLLRHVRQDGVYWFCMHCWQEMPDLSGDLSAKTAKLQQTHYRSSHQTKLPDQNLVAFIGKPETAFLHQRKLLNQNLVALISQSETSSTL